ncbi:SAM-dependent methyltransferase [Mycolicibacterium agri]|uniref:S-adenosyl-L-methionine-dependent methyltransferase n=1 Tax=Mycolicibacterium agri TaxID=36811 RepID=A0A2A7MNP8_MYCAG|nr:class I SAM-dependent methyltransferase [Mycolicibacterium agri]PEG33422.1 SAM-dependent methyltransferase [Mycolicibacterium agri]GFG53307.1 putative S-adenosyl-L-methionine-dependent methyltransferase [Mycolicibacterium agri]
MTDLHEVTSVRSEGDTWEITESVGATALGVAAARAVETARPDALIRDDFAYLLVAAAGPKWAQMASSDPDWLAEDEDFRRLHEMSRDYQAVRTHYFDEFFQAAMRAGVRQVVILAAGLDSRAYRLDWPARTTVFEIDQPKVLDYKTATLDAHGAEPRARRVPVGVDLRDDWPAALIEAGFDAAQPTAWLAEGLLPYLPADAQDRLFELVTAHSAAGSRIAVEAFSMDLSEQAEQDRIARRERTARIRALSGIDIDVDTLTYADADRSDAAEWLAGHGWRVEVVPSEVEMTRLGRPVPDYEAEEISSSALVRAERD